VAVTNGVCLFWFRQDLRLEDNPALVQAIAYATAHNQPLIPFYCVDDVAEAPWPLGGASRWYLHHTLKVLAKQLQPLGVTLHLLQGDTLTGVRHLLAQWGLPLQALTLFYTPRLEPTAIKHQEALTYQLQAGGGHVVANKGSNLLFDVENLRTKQGKPYQVFTPFWKACQPQLQAMEAPLPAPTQWPGPTPPASTTMLLEALQLLPTQPDWASGLRDTWPTTDEQSMSDRLHQFVAHGLKGYTDDRNRPDKVGTSGLGAALHFGQLSPRQIAHVVQQALADTPLYLAKDAECYLRELGWREFGHHLLLFFPHTPDTALRETYRDFPWEGNATWVTAWQRGETGYPIVDAGMRQLWHTGWMHNRVRMIVASFLVKHLLQPWQVGANWFWDTLVDASLSNNTMGWQWAAGCGADAAPYFRIFNPMLQGAKFDPEGAYVKRWVPELAGLSPDYIHTPWEAPPLFRQACGVTLGGNYPAPLVDHHTARAKALGALASLKT
jgi:deoxyribodipyrimidine photo-lyase